MDLSNFENFLSLSVSPLDLLVRGTIMYWFLFLLLRFVLRRDTGSAGISGILFVVLLGDAAQNAMIGKGHTVLDGIVLIATLAAWNLLLDWLGMHLKFVAKLVDAPPVLLVQHGELMKRNMRRELVTREEMEMGLRKEGLQAFDDVRAMYLEGDGTFSILKAKQ